MSILLYNFFVKASISLFLFILSITIGSSQLTINVTSVPATTPPDDTLFIAGSFNNWDPGHPTYLLTNEGDGTYYITFTPPAGTIEYKFTRGSWATVESNASGGFIPNRTYHYSGGMQSIDVSIAGWENIGNPHTAASNVEIIDEAFYIPQLDRTRRIWIYLPPNYEATSDKYPVIYMHDGQNLFDTYYSFAGEWQIDESMNMLFDQGDDGAIIVGIDNGGNQRINEYSPWFRPNYGGGDGELYAQFIVNTLKPFIDSNYRTLPEREYTAIAGSSLGANISMYTGIEYQEVFSKVGIFSPAFWFSDSIYLHVADKGVQEEMRIYFVAGDQESATMLSNIMAMYDTLLSEGVPSDQMQFVHHADGAHSEWYWAREYPDAYEWLFAETISGVHTYRIVKDIVYPNPADKLIRLSTEEYNAPFTIFSSVGNIVMSGKTVHNRIDITSLLPGLYIVELQAQGNTSYVSRFIKK